MGCCLCACVVCCFVWCVESFGCVVCGVQCVCVWCAAPDCAVLLSSCVLLVPSDLMLATLLNILNFCFPNRAINSDSYHGQNNGWGYNRILSDFT